MKEVIQSPVEMVGYRRLQLHVSTVKSQQLIIVWMHWTIHVILVHLLIQQMVEQSIIQRAKPEMFKHLIVLLDILAHYLPRVLMEL
eukprot:UN12585